MKSNQLIIYFIPITIVCILLGGCIESNIKDREEYKIETSGLKQGNSGYILVPVLKSQIFSSDSYDSEVSNEIASEYGIQIDDTIYGSCFNITLTSDISFHGEFETEEASYFPFYSMDDSGYDMKIFLHLESDQLLEIYLYSQHYDSYHWYESYTDNSILRLGWNNVNISYHSHMV